MAKKPATDAETTPATRAEQPIILIRGFGGLGVEDEKKIAYQGFNDGTVYPQKTGENYIYEGLILRFMKSRWTYNDATNIVGYYNSPVIRDKQSIPPDLAGFDHDLFSGHKIVIDPATALSLVKSTTDVRKSLWVFRYYDLDDREDFKRYGSALVRLITFIQTLAEHKHQAVPKVNIIAHSMGGLIVREAVQRSYAKGEAPRHINKIVTLGTPHQGISFQVLKDWIGIGAAKELEQFNPAKQEDPKNPVGFNKFAEHFPPERVLTVIGTNYRTYGPAVASWLNRAFSVSGEFGPNYNRSDGLVKQAFAQLPGAPRTFVHKCHGGPDSLVTSRESFEVATRFFFGNIKVRLQLISARVKRGKDLFGKSEFFFGVSIKPRRVDFELFHQSAEAENCYGPFSKEDLSDTSADRVSFNWADGDGGERLIWEGWLDTSASALATDSPREADKGGDAQKPPSDDIVIRLDFYLGERDLFGIGFSDNVVFRKQYYARAVFDDVSNLATLRELVLHTGEDFTDPKQAETMHQTSPTTWEFKITGTGFDATFGLTFAVV